MIEYVREIKVKKANNNSRFSVYNINDQLFMENDPLVLLDGVPVFNGNKLISYSPLNVERLEVIERKSLDLVLDSAEYTEQPLPSHDTLITGTAEADAAPQDQGVSKE